MWLTAHRRGPPEGDAVVFARRATVSDTETPVEEGVYTYDLATDELRLLVAGDVPNELDAPQWLSGGQIAVVRRAEAERPGEMLVFDAESRELQGTIQGNAPIARLLCGALLVSSSA